MKYLYIFLSIIISIMVFGEIEKYTIENGIDIIYEYNPSYNVSSISVFFDGGVLNYNPDKAGIEKLLLDIITKSNAEYSKDSLDYLIDKYGIKMDYDADYDYSYISLSSINKYFDETVSILSSMLNKPKIDKDIFEKSKKKLIADLKLKQHNIDNYIWYILNEKLYKGHPYYAFPNGKIETIENISIDDLKNHIAFLQRENRIIVSIVSGIRPEFIISLMKKNMYNLKSINKVKTVKSLSTLKKDTIIYIKKDNLQTKYVAGKFFIPSVNSDIYPISRIALSILSTKVYELLRTKYALTYAAFIGASGRKANYGYFYVSTDYPDSAITIVKEEFKRIKEKGIEQKDIDNIKRRFITGYLMQNEQAIRKSFLLGMDYILHNDFNYTNKFISNIDKIKKNDIQLFFNNYLNNLFILILE